MYNPPKFFHNLQALYPDMPGIKNGVCYGLSVMYVNAVLCNDVRSFTAHLALLSEVIWFFNDKIFIDFNEALEEAKLVMRGAIPGSRIEAQQYIDAWAFGDGVLAHQGGVTKIPAFSSQNVLRSTRMVLPKTLDQGHKTLHKVYDNLLAGNNVYFAQRIPEIFAAAQSKLKPEVQHDVAMFITQENHAIALSYNAEGQYCLFDQNHGGLQKFTDINAAITAIYQAFSFGSKKYYLIASVTVYTTPAKLKIAVGQSVVVLCTTWYARMLPTLQSLFPKSPLYPTSSHGMNREQQAAYVDNIVALAIRYQRSAPLPEIFPSGPEQIYCVDAIARTPALPKEQFEFDNLTDGALLLMACQGGHLHVLQHFLERYSLATLTQLSRERKSLLFHQICSRGNLALIECLAPLLHHEADSRNSFGQTPLFRACHLGQVEVVRELLKLGQININRQEKEFLTPLLVAFFSGHVDVVSLLIADPRVDINVLIDKHTLLYSACQNGQLNMIRILLASPRIEVNRPGEEHPLFIAVEMGHVAVVQTLLAEPRVHIDQMLSGLMIKTAFKNKRHDIMALLLSNPRVSLMPLTQRGIPRYPGVLKELPNQTNVEQRPHKKLKLTHAKA